LEEKRRNRDERQWTDSFLLFRKKESKEEGVEVSKTGETKGKQSQNTVFQQHYVAPRNTKKKEK